ncbi:hypothetical protein SASPL_145611 [Salvia splendens]|uniref:NAD-dependent epimerase/dehydratase domain-containing protein n=3 Tax=Salvia splendens TaxID=180675 RepID=A0A8X8WHV6_SALSN|nr:hypothetical protein SASPL_145611 [Salvia splendens]
MVPAELKPRQEPSMVPAELKPRQEPSMVPAELKPRQEPSMVPAELKPRQEPSMVPAELKPRQEPSMVPAELKPRQEPSMVPAELKPRPEPSMVPAELQLRHEPSRETTKPSPPHRHGDGGVALERRWLRLQGCLRRDLLESSQSHLSNVLYIGGERSIEVVSLACARVGGERIQSFLSGSMNVLIAQALNDKTWYKGLRELEDLDSKVPIAHVQDVIEAHIFAMENSEMNGRFLVASDFLK